MLGTLPCVVVSVEVVPYSSLLCDDTTSLSSSLKLPPSCPIDVVDDDERYVSCRRHRCLDGRTNGGGIMVAVENPSAPAVVVVVVLIQPPPSPPGRRTILPILHLVLVDDDGDTSNASTTPTIPIIQPVVASLLELL